MDVGEGELHRFDLQVLRGDAVDLARGEVEVLQDAERDLRRDALPVGRDLMQGLAAIVMGQRRDPFGRAGGEVGRGDRTAVFARVARRRLGDLAAVVGLAAGLRDEPQGARGGGKTKQLADTRRAPPGQEGLGEARQRRELGRGGGPFLLDHDRHRVTALGDLDRRLDQIGERQLAEALAQGDPAGHRAGHRHAVPAALGRRGGVGAVATFEVIRRPGLRRAARGVEAVQTLAVPQDAERIGAEPVADRLDDGHRRRRRDRRVDRIAAGQQHAQPGLRGHRMRGRHDIAAEDRQPLARVAGTPVKCAFHGDVSFDADLAVLDDAAARCRPGPSREE